MFKTGILICLIFLLACTPEKKPAVLLISIDGLKMSHLQDAQKQGINLPNLARFIQEGSYAEGVIGVFPTLTYPSHTSLITGVTPKVHGITHNFVFEPSPSKKNDWTWFSEDIQVPTLWEQAKKAGLTTANVDWPVSVGAQIDFSIVQYWQSGQYANNRLIRSLSTVGLVKIIEKILGETYPVGDWSLTGDQKRVHFAEYIISMHQPGFMTLYLASLDDIQHKTGPDSRETLITLAGLDKLLGQLLDTAQKTYGQKFIIAVVSDHGFVPVSKSINLNAAFQQAGLIQLDNQQQLVDWQVYSLAGEGITKIRLRDKHDKKLYERVRKLLMQLSANPANGIDRILEQPAINRLGGFPEADFIAASKAGYVFRDSLTGPLISSTVDYVGSHGFMPDIPDMQSSFFIMGPGIPKHNNIGTISMLDIAPTLAKLQGFKLSQAEGKVLFR